jgi:hypothetical protein
MTDKHSDDKQVFFRKDLVSSLENITSSSKQEPVKTPQSSRFESATSIPPSDEALDNLVRDIMQVPYSKHKAKVAIAAYASKRERAARIDENQRRLDKIVAWRNRKPVPGELTSASFGSAGAAMEVAGFEQSFKDRIAELQANEEQTKPLAPSLT